LYSNYQLSRKEWRLDYSSLSSAPASPDIRAVKLILSSVFLTLSIATAFAVEPIELKLWPEGAPGVMKPPATQAPSNPNVVTNITNPTLTIYRPEKPNGAAVVVAPGGGYRFLSIKHEGTQVCEWLNSIGVTAGLLTYRTPTNEEPNSYEKPVQDAQRAIGLIRHHASEWGIVRVGLLGFSAGGNLLGHAAFDRTERTYPQNPEFDGNARPDFIVMIYGGGFLDKDDKTKFRPGFSVPADAPPAFFLVAHDDKTNPTEAAMLYLEYKKQNIPAELHIFTLGGHGFGMRKDGHPINEWPQRAADWMQSMGYLK
jgi:acetyl esterase/lipase